MDGEGARSAYGPQYELRWFLARPKTPRRGMGAWMLGASPFPLVGRVSAGLPSSRHQCNLLFIS